MARQAARRLAVAGLATGLAACAGMNAGADTGPLAGSAWVLAGLPGGAPVPGTTVTLAFDARTAAGSAGCNRWSAPYAEGPGTVTFGTTAVTRRFCAEPAGVMQQEQAFLAALGTVATARRADDRLELRTADGALAVVLAVAP